MTPIYIDTFNLAYMARITNRERVIAYSKVFDYLKATYQDPDAVAADLDITCYVHQTERSHSFVAFLQDYANVKCREIRDSRIENFDVELCVDVLANISPKMVICSASKNLAPLLKQLWVHNTSVYIHGIAIPKEFRQYASCVEFGNGAFVDSKPSEPARVPETPAELAAVQKE